MSTSPSPKIAPDAPFQSEAERLVALLDHLQIVESQTDLDRLVGGLLSMDRPRVVSFLNQHAFNLAAENPAFCADLLSADMLLRDGVGLEICLKLLGRPAGMNTNGTDLIPKILTAAKGRRIAVFGTAEPWLSRAVERLAPMTGEIVAIADGFQPPEHYRDLLLQTRPDVVVLAMGMPRQERRAADIAGAADWPLLILNGGAILDFLAQRFARAPRGVQAVRMEWLFRLLQEPKRLANRYLLGGGAFVRRVAQVRAKLQTERRR